MTQTSTTTDRLAAEAAMVRMGMADATATQLVQRWTAEEVATFLAADVKAQRDRDELRARLMADPALRSVICPPTTWKTAEDRYDVARRALRLVEAAARKAKADISVIVAELVKQGDSIAREIELYGEDPRNTQWGRDFYGFRFRLADAINGSKREEKARKWAAKVARHEAQGEVVCDHCGGKGGADHWPGFTCFECNGAGFVPKKG